MEILCHVFFLKKVLLPKIAHLYLKWATFLYLPLRTEKNINSLFLYFFLFLCSKLLGQKFMQDYIYFVPFLFSVITCVTLSLFPKF